MRSRAGTSRLQGVAAALLGVAMMIGVLPRPAAAQAVSGTIVGTVTDASGAVIVGAKVTLTNEGTQYTRTVTSDANGEYAAPQLPTGNYTVLAEMTGFKATALSSDSGRRRLAREDGRQARSRPDDRVGEDRGLDSAAADVLLRARHDRRTPRQIKALPLNGRNFVNLTRTIPGVLRGIPGANIDGAGSLAWRASASFSANGNRPRDNNYMLDGVDNNETWLQTVVIFPSPDALDEFKMQTSTYSAEFGRSLGGVVNLQIKSGSNVYHGSGFEFLRNDAFDANNFFNNKNRRAKPDFSQNQFGGTFGGPVFKDKTFFFADYQGQRITQGQTLPVHRAERQRCAPATSRS